MSLPRFIHSRSLTDLLNAHIEPGQPKDWSYQRVNGILKRLGIARKEGRCIYVAPEDLAGSWPEMYEVILEKLKDIKPFVHGHTKHRLERERAKKSGEPYVPHHRTGLAPGAPGNKVRRRDD